ncbi:lysylphosphatidylglycerol synthase domain-containing protein [Nocardioides sp. Kera G14]|uniref:lysylphosphatidylglycerol synthase domain-containing protein n=1 Tax=Nocardioides sp. Kera G14 TaxID=2884264 RepID=UPI001D0F8E86|nr:lysylphosphatidylglycerol synthase domain-containing protein [Nocardioides sp. Kera G14]UDY22677.1 flippase-like domain-containing protein [Nocardioides sp. Kera G14]
MVTPLTRALSGGALRWAIALVVLAFCGWLIWRHTDDLGGAIRSVSWWRFALSGLLAVIGTVLIERTWAALLHGFGVRPPTRETASMFYVSQLGKYVPGSVWPVLAQMQFGARWGISRSVMFAANLLLLGIVTGSGIIVGALLLPWTSADGLAHYWWLLLLLPPLAVALHPRTIPALLNRGLRKLGREPLPGPPSYVALLGSAGWMTLGWLVLGLHVAVLLSAFGAVTPARIAASIGSIALGWAAGIAFIPAPAGAGIRDGIITLTLTPLIGATEAVTVALASRGLLLLADVVLAAISAVSARSSDRDRATSE